MLQCQRLRRFPQWPRCIMGCCQRFCWRTTVLWHSLLLRFTGLASRRANWAGGARNCKWPWTFSLKTKGPTPHEVTGKYLMVWEKIGSDWKLAADIWNDGK